MPALATREAAAGSAIEPSQTAQSPPAATRPSRRERLARLERPLLIAGTALVLAHVLDLAFAGPQTSAVGIAVLVALAVGLVIARPHVSRLTRFALAVPLGLMFAVTGALAHVLDLFTSGPRWTDLSGVGATAGGLLLIASGLAALAAPPRQTRPRVAGLRAAHPVAWVAGALVITQFVFVPLLGAVITTHAVRLPVDDAALTVAHHTVTIPAPTGDVAAWYVPSHNGAAVLIVPGSGSSRADVAGQAELVARHGYGVLAIDPPGQGESDGRANLLGANSQPAVAAALAWLGAQPGIKPSRIAGFGMSMGGEVLLDAASKGEPLAAVISDGAERPADDRELGYESGLAGLTGPVERAAVRAVSGASEPPALVDVVGKIAPRPILLIATGAREHEIAANRAYAAAAGANASVWAIPQAGHTGGLDSRPVAYARHVSGFLDRTVGPGAPPAGR